MGAQGLRTLDPLIKSSSNSYKSNSISTFPPFVPGLKRKGNWKMSKRRLKSAHCFAGTTGLAI